MLPEVQLNELQDLHCHVKQIHRGAVEWKMSELPGFTVNNRKETVRDV